MFNWLRFQLRTFFGTSPYTRATRNGHTKIGTENVHLSRDVVVMQRELMTFEKEKPK